MADTGDSTTDSTVEAIWHNSYPASVPHSVTPDPARTLADVLDDSCRQFASQVAFSQMGGQLTYSDLEQASRHFAAYLRHEIALDKGERVALMMPNLAQYPIALFGVLRAGLIVVNVNPLYTARELSHQLEDSGARAIVIVENFAATLEKALPDSAIETVITTRVGDRLPFPKNIVTNLVVKHVKRMVPAFSLDAPVAFNDALARGAARSFEPPELDGQDLAFLQYTGGTTGLAKGARLSHANMVANLAQCSAWIGPWIERGRERIITALPLYHVFALTANCLVFLEQGGNNRLVMNPRDIPGLVKTFRDHRPTAFTGVNTLFNGLINNDEFARLDFSALKLTLGGGAAIQKTVADAWQKITGCTLVEAYGLSETAPGVAINRLDAEAHTAKIGLPIPSTELSIRDDEGREVALDERGELCVRGPQVMDNYWGFDDTERAEFFTDDNYFRTGDIATLDADGYLAIVDRKKDMINVSGFNVFPNEVEAVIAEHPKVLEAGCVGVTDEKSGELVKAFVVRREPDVSDAELIEFCRERLTGYKVPHVVEFVDELPKSNVGKILRKELRAA